jgi:CBS domain-containing protein
MTPNSTGAAKAAEGTGAIPFRFLFFSELVGRRVCAGKIRDRIGVLEDLVVRVSEHLPEAVGLYLEHGWGKPTEFVPWGRVRRIEDDAIFVEPAEGGGPYPPFVDQPGWMLLDRHLVGRTILDTDGRRIEAVNDVHLVESSGRLAVVHVDTSFNGFLRRWGLGWLHLLKDDFISWKYVQPLSVEDALATDKVSLSITRRQLRELPSEDLADALEELSGDEQEALFSALDSEKAAETLVEAEPRAQRQLIAGMRKERARTVLSEMSVPQLADLFTILPHDQAQDMIGLLPPAEAERLRTILSEREASAQALMSADYFAVGRDVTVGDVLRQIRGSGRETSSIWYVYVLADEAGTLAGVLDLRDLVLAPDEKPVTEVMTAPVITAEAEDPREDIEALFLKYHFRVLPVADLNDHLLGVIHYNDIMRGLVTRAKV